MIHVGWSDEETKLKEHLEVHIDKLSCNLCEKKIHPRSMSRHIKSAHSITQDDDNFPVITNQCNITKITFRPKLLPTCHNPTNI